MLSSVNAFVPIFISIAALFPWVSFASPTDDLQKNCVGGARTSSTAVGRVCFPDAEAVPLSQAQYETKREVIHKKAAKSASVHEFARSAAEFTAAKNSSCANEWAQMLLDGSPAFKVPLQWADAVAVSKSIQHPKILVSVGDRKAARPHIVIALPNYGDCTGSNKRKLALDLVRMARLWERMESDAKYSNIFNQVLSDPNSVYRFILSAEGCPGYGLVEKSRAFQRVAAHAGEVAPKEPRFVADSPQAQNQELAAAIKSKSPMIGGLEEVDAQAILDKQLEESTFKLKESGISVTGRASTDLQVQIRSQILSMRDVDPFSMDEKKWA